MAGNDPENKTEEMIDLDRLDAFTAELREAFPDLKDLVKDKSSYFKLETELFLDKEKNPAFYLDKEIQRTRINKLIEALHMQKVQEKLQKDVEELKKDTSEAVVNTAETVLNKDIDNDGKIGGKDIKEVDNSKIEEPKNEEPKNEDPKINDPKSEAPKIEPVVHPDFDDIFTDISVADREKNPDEYKDPQKVKERTKKLSAISRSVEEAQKLDREANPDYYSNQDLANKRSSIVKDVIEYQQGLHSNDSPQALLAKQFPIGTADTGRKTVTDLYNGENPEKAASFEDMVKQDLIRDNNGAPLPHDMAPWEYERMIKEATERNTPIYVVDKSNKVHILVRAENQYKHQEAPEAKLVGAKLKNDTIRALEDLRNVLPETDSTAANAEDYSKFKTELDKGIKELKTVIFEKAFIEKINSISEKANEYIQANAELVKPGSSINSVDVAKSIVKAVNDKKEEFKPVEEKPKEELDKNSDTNEKIADNEISKEDNPEIKEADIKNDGKQQNEAVKSDEKIDEKKNQAEIKKDEIPVAKAAALYDILSEISSVDKKMYPEEYSNPQKTEARAKKLLEASKAVAAAQKLDRELNPDYYRNIDPKLTELRDKLVKNAVECQMGLHPDDSPLHQMAKQFPLGTADTGCKTVTDLYNGKNPEKAVSFEDMVKLDLVRDVNGDPLPRDKAPWEYERMIKEAAERNEAIYVVDKNNKVHSLIQEDDQYKTLQIPDKKLVGSKIKKDAIGELETLKKTLDEAGSSRGDSEEYKKFKSELDEGIEDLKTSAFDNEFKERLNKINEKANDYIVAKVGQRNSALRMKRVDAAKNIQSITKAVNSNKEASKNKPELTDSLRFDIACRAVKSFAESFKDSEDKVKSGLAEHILSDNENFTREVEKAMKDPGFVALFGDKNHPANLKFLQNAATSKGSDILKSVKAKTKEMDESEIKAIRDSQRRINTVKKFDPISAPDILAIQQTILDVRKDMLKGNYKEGKNPVLDEFMEELEIAQIRIEGGSPHINYRNMSAKLADLADKLNKSSLEDSGWRRVINSSKIMHMDDCLREGKSLSANPYDINASLKKELASKIVIETQQKLQKSELLSDKKTAKNFENKAYFRQRVNKVLESDAFKEMVKGLDEGGLKKMLKNDPEEMALELGKANIKLKGYSDEEVTKRAMKIQEKNKARIEKKLEQELDDAKKYDAPSAMFR